MVYIYTVENNEYADVEVDVASIRDELRRQREHLLGLAEADATVVDELFSTTADETDQYLHWKARRGPDRDREATAA